MKNEIKISIRVPAEFKKAMDDYSRKTGISLSWMIRQGVELYLKQQAKR